MRYDENNITINYLGVWYKNPDGLLYSYKMENYDRDWITTKNQAVTYSRLPPGNYMFKLKVSESSDFSQCAGNVDCIFHSSSNLANHSILYFLGHLC